MSPEAERLIAEGNRAENEGRLDEACALYRRAVAEAPRSAKAHVNLGIGLEALGDADAASACYEKALELDAAQPFANYNLGKLNYARGELAAAERRLRHALQSRPAFPEARVVLGCVLDSLGRSADAAQSFQAALAERPQDFAALYHLAGALGELGRHDEALAAIERALALQPANLDALYRQATTLMRLGREAPAESALRRVIAGAPQSAPAYRMLGSLLHREGRVEEMLALFPATQSFELESFELFLLNFSDRIADQALFERHRAFGERLEAVVAPRFAHGEPRDPERRLRVGYVSGELNSHPVGLFLLPVLERHDRARFHACCYSTSTKSDALTAQLSARADLWREASGLSEQALAEQVHADRIDVLVDLSGHSGISRLGTFALQPAPVQAAWLGYLHSTGLTRIRYRITDAVADPPGAEQRHTESLLRLPRPQWCYRPLVPVDAPRARRGGPITFGSFTQVAKISPATRELWATILEALPEARLKVFGAPAGLALTPIDSARATLVPFQPLREYFAAFRDVDVALDTTPYSGGTTTCDALWMGVPVLTMPGARSASRSAASILTALGLDEWIAPNPREYVRRAVAFASTREKLATLRATLRGRMQSSPLMDEAGFTRDLENAYRQMWRTYCAQGR